ncbi:hypothetical protein, partial [Eubacterium sp.]|uniref:hypothetical protein n=1 Tax=Eubacterium sp. TaxID=142586 RepID=UPI0026DECB09
SVDVSGILDALGKILSAILGLPNQLIDGIANAAYALFAPLIQLIPDAITQGWAQGIGEIKTYFSGLADSLKEKLQGLGITILNPDGTPLELPDKFPLEWPVEFPWEIPQININWGELFPWELPEIHFPEIPNYFEILGQILQGILNIKDLVVLDIPAIQTAAQQAIDNFKIDTGMDGIADIFHMFQFSSTYEYPKIKVKTPDIIKQYYDHEEIVLLDFGDYKDYCLMARNIFSFTAYLAFLWWCFKHLKVQLHIG